MSKAERMDPAEAARARQDPETIVVNAPVGEPEPEDRFLEFGGRLMGVEREPGEGNEAYRVRIVEAYKGVNQRVDQRMEKAHREAMKPRTIGRRIQYEGRTIHILYGTRVVSAKRPPKASGPRNESQGRIFADQPKRAKHTGGS